jgi:tetratricopeptide (TPR) repeat protein
MFSLLLALLVLHGSASAEASFLIFPLENRAAPALAWVGEGIALSVGEQMRVTGIEVIGRDERQEYVTRADLPSGLQLSNASMIRVAQIAEADYIVTGWYSGTDDKVDISLQAIDLKTMRRGGAVSARGPLAELPQMENELAYNILSNAGLNKSADREAFRERTRRVPNNAYAQFVESLQARNEEDQVTALKRAVALHADFPQALFRLGRYYYEAGKCDSAIRYLEPARKWQLRYLESQFMLGVCYLKKNALTEAVRSFSAIVPETRSVATLNNLGVAELRRRDYAPAVQHLAEAYKLSRADFAVALNLAILHYLQGDTDAARTVLEQILAGNPNRPVALYLLSRVLETRGESEKAAEVLAQAKRVGADTEKLRTEEPGSWCRVFDAWDQGPLTSADQ